MSWRETLLLWVPVIKHILPWSVLSQDKCQSFAVESCNIACAAESDCFKCMSCRIKLIIGCFATAVENLVKLQEVYLYSHKQSNPNSAILTLPMLSNAEVAMFDLRARPVRRHFRNFAPQPVNKHNSQFIWTHKPCILLILHNYIIYTLMLRNRLQTIHANCRRMITSIVRFQLVTVIAAGHSTHTQRNSGFSQPALSRLSPTPAGQAPLQACSFVKPELSTTNERSQALWCCPSTANSAVLA